jgi:hypothetical protein
MTDSARPKPLDRYTQIGNLADSVRWGLQRVFLLATVALAGETAFLFATGSAGATAFALIALGTLLVLAVWRPSGIGLPIVPLIAVQHLVVYGLPIVIGHEVLEHFPEQFVTMAGVEVLIFSVALAAAWRLGMTMFRPASAMSYALQGFNQETAGKLKRLGFGLILGSSLHIVLESLNLFAPVYAVLPEGSTSLVTTLVSAAGACGFFLVAMFVGTGDLSIGGRILFWGLLAGDCFIRAAGFLLSASTALLASVLIGLFWSTGRLPRRFLIVVLLILAFLNLGKFTMREQYWAKEGDSAPQFSLRQMPDHYAEWVQASYDALTPGGAEAAEAVEGAKRPKSQNLLERINNLENLLFVIDAVEVSHVQPLHGATYALIPPLFVPRIFWPEKPRTHEGQVLLNVHFGRQDLNATFQTYIAWGLLPEAYGNFGPRGGAIFLGLCLGLFFAAVENFTARKLLLSVEGFISFTLLLDMAGSFEMVASVLVTAIFQSVVLLVIASVPFVERTILRRPGEEPA